MLREKLSLQNFQLKSLLSSRKFSNKIFCVVALALSFSLSSCNNIGSLKGRFSTSEVTLSDPESGTNSGAFRLDGVYASQQSPGSMFDMVGADEQYDTYCAGTYGPCVCEYTYTSPGVGVVTDQGTVQYQESNLLRCMNVVPSGISSFDVKILATGSNDYSNSVSVNLTGGGFVNTNYVDLTKEEAYTMVKRYQCRKREFIYSPLNKTMIDPIQSEDPKVIYPFNFYTTNIASSLWEMQQADSQEWDCTLTPTHDRSLHWWANPNVYSASPCTETFCAGDDELMYPQDDLVSGKVPVNNLTVNGKRRGSFHLAKTAYGVFQIPVKAAVGPKDYVSSRTGTIGYAARPIPNAAGSSSCPSITLPANAEWVKLWNFRATDITPPKKVTSIASAEASGIGCNTIAGVFPSCDNPGAATMATANVDWRAVSLSSIPFTNIPTINFPTPNCVDGNCVSQLASNPTASDTLASRVAVLTTNAGTMNACYDITSMGNGQEAWEPSPFGFSGAGLGVVQGLPWNILSMADSIGSCGTTVDWVDWDGGAVGGACTIDMLQREPADTSLVLEPLNTSNYTDQIFVVTSPDVDDTNMRNQAIAVSHYKPVTYRTSNDCNTISRSGCPIGKEIHWDINIKDVGAPTGPDQYPLCVLQFTD